MADINETRRKKLLVYLHQEGGVMAIGPLHDWSGLKLLAAHQAFSQLMEGLTSDGLVTWDGTIFTLTAEGKAAAEAAGKEKGRGKKKAEGEAAEAVEAAVPVAVPVAAPVAVPAVEDRGHSHDHDHGHSHDHGAREPKPAPAPRPAAPKRAPPPPPPPETGVRALVKKALRRLLKMEK
jgi:hypothetical protein